MSRTSHGPGLSGQRLRALVAAAGALLLLGPPVAATLHAAELAAHEPGPAPQATTLSHGCPADCPDPHHHHGLHDHGACALCQGHGRLSGRTPRVAVVAVLGHDLRLADEPRPVSRDLARCRRAPRGPPAC